MMTSHSPTTPPPGSAEALHLSCKCPVIDNGYGRGYMGGVADTDGRTIYVYTLDCPVHTVTETPAS